MQVLLSGSASYRMQLQGKLETVTGHGRGLPDTQAGFRGRGPHLVEVVGVRDWLPTLRVLDVPPITKEYAARMLHGQLIEPRCSSLSPRK